MPFTADKNYFELFDLPAAFDIDLSDLTRRYRDLARQLHPDRFAKGSDQERRLAMQSTALLNEAFHNLRNPVDRARYLLRLRGVELDDESDTAMDPAFLDEQLEIRERLEAARDSTDPQQRLSELARAVESRLARAVDALRVLLATETGDSGGARRLAREMQFLERLRQQVAEAQDHLG